MSQLLTIYLKDGEIIRFDGVLQFMNKQTLEKIVFVYLGFLDVFSWMAYKDLG